MSDEEVQEKKSLESIAKSLNSIETGFYIFVCINVMEMFIHVFGK